MLYSGNASPAMTSASLDVMAQALQFTNDNCLASAIHGLGHRALDAARAEQILQQWLQRPTTQNAAVIRYAKQAMTGCIQ